MYAIIRMMKFNKKYLYVLGLILLISLFFRTFAIIDRASFSHDGDLYSWIVKDIVINHHFRLIGQETSAPGIFIGPLFYYLLIPFFLLTNMDPIGAIFPILIFGILTTLSCYFVFSKLFNNIIGLIGAFLQATLLSLVNWDRWIVPTAPTHLWTIWFLYIVVSIARGNYFLFPVLGFLAGLTWHIHVALAPTFLAVPVAIIISKKLPSLKKLGLFIIAFLIPTIPLFLFELRHNFSQTVNLLQNFTISHGGGVGFSKLNLLIIKMINNLSTLLTSPQSLPGIDHRILSLLVILILIWMVRKKIILIKDLLPLLFWILGIILFYSFSSTIISEYYLENINVIYLLLISLLLYKLWNIFKYGKIIVLFLLAIILIKNLIFFTTVSVYKEGYLEKKAVVEYIYQDSLKQNFPCFAISYITDPGRNTGFRYLFWLKKLHVNQPSSGSPVYTIVIPSELAQEAIKEKFGNIGVILPDNIPDRKRLENSCSGQNSNLTDPLFGYTE